MHVAHMKGAVTGNAALKASITAMVHVWIGIRITVGNAEKHARLGNAALALPIGFPGLVAVGLVPQLAQIQTPILPTAESAESDVAGINAIMGCAVHPE